MSDGSGVGGGGVSVTPSELRFRFALNKQLLATITINNGSDIRTAFKVKTTAPKKYVVRPSSGVVEAGASVSIQVIMQAQKEYPSPADFASCKDKFMVQTVGLPPGEELSKETFKTGAAGLRESRMRVVLEGHASPPSTILEDEEGSGLGSVGAAAAGASGIAAAAASTASPARGGSDRVRSAEAEVATASASNAQLKKDVERLTGDRDKLRRTLDQVQLQRSTSPTSGGGKPAVDLRVALVNLALSVLLAFLLGYLT